MIHPFALQHEAIYVFQSAWSLTCQSDRFIYSKPVSQSSNLRPTLTKNFLGSSDTSIALRSSTRRKYHPLCTSASVTWFVKRSNLCFTVSNVPLILRVGQTNGILIRTKNSGRWKRKFGLAVMTEGTKWRCLLCLQKSRWKC